jgi:D-glycero-alpha-D-manno-heptose-7-phosphate kinase
MYFVTDYDKKSNVSKALAKAGATISEFNFEPEGVVSWRSKA